MANDEIIEEDYPSLEDFAKGYDINLTEGNNLNLEGLPTSDTDSDLYSKFKESTLNGTDQELFLGEKDIPLLFNLKSILMYKDPKESENGEVGDQSNQESNSVSIISSQSNLPSVKRKVGRPRKQTVDEECIEQKVKKPKSVHTKRSYNALLAMIDNLTEAEVAEGLNSSNSETLTRSKGKKKEYPLIKFYRPFLFRYFRKCIKNRKMDKIIGQRSNEEALAVNHFLTQIDLFSEKLLEFKSKHQFPLTKNQSALKHQDGSEFSDKVGNEREKSFNNRYVMNTLKEPFMLQIWIYFVEALFTGKSCAQLCMFFNFSCCRAQAHTGLCIKKWEELAQFTALDLVFRQVQSKKQKIR